MYNFANRYVVFKFPLKTGIEHKIHLLVQLEKTLESYRFVNSWATSEKEKIKSSVYRETVATVKQGKKIVEISLIAEKELSFSVDVERVEETAL